MNSVQDIKKELNRAKDFLCLAEMFNIQPEVKKHPPQQTRSLYQAVSEGRDIVFLDSMLEAYFGTPKKKAGQRVTKALFDHPAVKYLGGLEKEQVLYLKKTRTGSYYGLLAPEPQGDKISIHLGFCPHRLSEKNHHKLEKQVQTNLHHTWYVFFVNLSVR